MSRDRLQLVSDEAADPPVRADKDGAWGVEEVEALVRLLNQDRLQRVADEAAELDPDGVLDVVGLPGVSRREIAWQIARGVLAAIPLLGLVLAGLAIDAAELSRGAQLGYGLPLMAASFAYMRYGVWRILGSGR